MSTTSPTPDHPTGTTDALAERLFDSLVGALELLSIHLGDKLGWYRSLVEDGPATPAELARRTGSQERYAREWLEQQAVAGLLGAQSDEDGSHRFSIGPAAAEVLTNRRSLSYLIPTARILAAAAGQLPALVDAYRDGGGVSWAQYGEDMLTAQADGNRPLFEAGLPGALAGLPDVHERISRPGARIADVGCGAGWSAISLAKAYPKATLVGFDIDEPSVELARLNAAAEGVADRVSFHAVDGADLPAGEGFDLALALECVHDMSRPVEVLAAVRRALVPGGSLVVVDEAVAERFAPDGDQVERLFYGYSVLVCLPDGLSHDPSEGTGTVMRESTLRGYAERAGFSSTRVLPVKDFGFFRFYELS